MDGHDEKRKSMIRESENHHSVSAQAESKLYESIRHCLTDARAKAFHAINTTMVQAYWEIGREIAEALGDHAEYGKQLFPFLSQKLTTDFGKGFTVANLRIDVVALSYADAGR